MKMARKSLTLPKVTRTSRKLENDDYKDFPLAHYSYSTFVKFSTDPFMFKLNYKQGKQVNTALAAKAVLGKAVHKALETYFGGNEEVPVTEDNALEMALKVGTAYIENYHEGMILFNKTTFKNKADIIKKVVFCINSYVAEYGTWEDNIVDLEGRYEHKIDVEWRGKQVTLPIKLKGYIDKIKRDEEGRLVVSDYKTKDKYSDPDKLDGGKMLQAVEYYFLAYAQYGEPPYAMEYEEIKYTKNADGSNQTKKYRFIYDEMDLFFDFYFRFYDDMTRAIMGEQVYVPNIYAIFDKDISIIAYAHRLDDEEEVAKQMKKLKVDTISDLLKKKLARTQKMRNFMKNIEKSFAEVKSINYAKMNTDEKIKMKLMEFGISVSSEGVISGKAVDTYLVKPSFGVKIKEIKNAMDDIALLLGVDSVRVVQHKTNIGIEVPKDERIFVHGKPERVGWDIAMGVNSKGDDVYMDMRTFPHLLIAGETGSGKSVFMDSLLHQLETLSRCNLRLIDPKGTEMMHYEHTAHSYTDDIVQANELLEHMVSMMNSRFDRLKGEKGTRARKFEDTSMPYEFVFIDEFGDLIAQNFKQKRQKAKTKVRVGVKKTSETTEISDYEVNISQEIMKNIQLLAQKGRAAGIHLVIATQRPSVDVIKGSIKANFPAKAVFRVAKAIDSQVIIDESGAESLLGKGDMLFKLGRYQERLQGYSM